MGHEASLLAAPERVFPSVCSQLGFDLDREVFPMVVHAVVDEGDGERGEIRFPCCQGLCWQHSRAAPALMPFPFSLWGLILCPAMALCALSLPPPCVFAEHAGHSHVLLATFEKVSVGLAPSSPLPDPSQKNLLGAQEEAWAALGPLKKVQWEQGAGRHLGALGQSQVGPPLYFLPQHTDGTFCVKPLKQKQVVSELQCWGGVPGGTCHTVSPFLTFPVHFQVDGVSYLLQEIYGIENKYNTQDSKVEGCQLQPAALGLSLPLSYSFSVAQIPQM